MHKLARYLKAERISYSDFAQRIGVSNGSVAHRYAHGRVPRSPEVMSAIVRETGGAVQPADWFDNAGGQ